MRQLFSQAGVEKLADLLVTDPVLQSIDMDSPDADARVQARTLELLKGRVTPEQLTLDPKTAAFVAKAESVMKAAETRFLGGTCDESTRRRFLESVLERVPGSSVATEYMANALMTALMGGSYEGQ